MSILFADTTPKKLLLGVVIEDVHTSQRVHTEFLKKGAILHPVVMPHHRMLMDAVEDMNSLLPVVGIMERLNERFVKVTFEEFLQVITQPYRMSDPFQPCPWKGFIIVHALRHVPMLRTKMPS